MAKPRLIIVEAHDRYSYSIGWYFPDEGEEGGILGDGRQYTEADLKRATRDDREHILACLAAAKTDGVERTSRGFIWDSRSAAAKALRAINAAIKSDEAPWPEWAVKARAEGWKAPKGWKP